MYNEFSLLPVEDGLVRQYFLEYLNRNNENELLI